MSKKRKNRQKKQKEKQQMQDKQKQSNILREVASYVIIIIIAILLSAHLNVVVSGSMEPAFYRGDIVVTEGTNIYGIQEFNPETDVNIGDVVVYDATWYSEPVIHRVIAEEYINGSKYFEIKGDHNNQADPYLVTPSQIKAKVVTIGDYLFIIPKIGYITLFFRGL